MASPFFSIVMAVKNGMPYLATAMESILSQTFSDFEFIIVDDHSTDESPEYLRRLQDSRLVLLSAHKQGQTPALNQALRQARGEWIARMDGDDWSYPQRLQRQIEAINASASPAVLVTSDYWVCDDALDSVGLVRLEQPNPKLFRYLSKRNNPICHPTVCFRRETATEVGGYDEALINAQDIRLWHKLLAHGTWLHVPEPLLKYRVLKGSLSVRFQPEQTSERQTVMRQNQEPEKTSLIRKEASTALTVTIYHYKLGFAAWVAGDRMTALHHLTRVLRSPTRYGIKAAALVLTSLCMPRRLYLRLCGYHGVFA